MLAMAQGMIAALDDFPGSGGVSRLRHLCPGIREQVVRNPNNALQTRTGSSTLFCVNDDNKRRWVR